MQHGKKRLDVRRSVVTMNGNAHPTGGTHDMNVRVPQDRLNRRRFFMAKRHDTGERRGFVRRQQVDGQRPESLDTGAYQRIGMLGDVLDTNAANVSEAGVDGVFTDFPDRAVQFLNTKDL